MIKNASKAKTWAPSKIYTVGHFGLLQSFGIFEGFTGQHNKELEQKNRKPLKMESHCIIVSDKNDNMQLCPYIENKILYLIRNIKGK